MTSPALSVRSLGVTLRERGDERSLLADVGFDLARGECLGIVGGSGAGKSTLALALLGLLPKRQALVPGTSVQLAGEELSALDEPSLRALRGRRIALVFQEPLLALDPSMRIGAQLVESIRVHDPTRRRDAPARAEEALARVGIPRPREAMTRFPHEFSGGMRQRALIAAATVLEPDVLIADEPTTALDPTLQAQVLDLLDTLRRRTGMAVVLISHDLDVIGERCERALVLDAGRVVESAATSALLRAPSSAAGSRLAAAHRRSAATPGAFGGRSDAPILDVEELHVTFTPRRSAFGRASPPLRAVAGVSLHIARGEALGLVGESGCGKTSLARAILRLGPHSSGRVRFAGVDLFAADAEAMRRTRLRLQYVPQDAGASLAPHFTVAEIVAEGIEVHQLAEGAAVGRRVSALLDRLGLSARVATARPAELSAGERQRVAIARALAVEPELLICDEPVASVDAATRATLLDELDALRRERGLALLLISHDVDAIRRVTARMAVMYLGRIVEMGETAVIATGARMPYTQQLLAAEPSGDPAALARRLAIIGEVPAPANEPAGCPFHPRCSHALRDAECTAARPPLETLSPGHQVACWKA